MDDDNEGEALLDFLYACPVGLVEIDGDGAIGLMNPFAMKLLLPLAGQRGCANLFTVLEAVAPELRHLVAGFAAPRGTICDNHRIVVDLAQRGRGGRDPVTLACTLVRINPDRVIATIADVSAAVAQERRLKQAETWFSSLVNGVNDYAVVLLSPSGAIEASNPAFERQTGHAGADVVGRRLDSVLRGAAASGTQALPGQLRHATRDGWCLEESWQTRRSGERYLCQRLIVTRPGVNGGTEGFVAVLRDVAQRGDDAPMLHLLTHDQLTGASNRTAFKQMVEREARRWHEEAQPLSLIMVDLDHFKSINDRHGHPVGDEVLRRVSATCIAVLRPGDLFARLGGEEFAALLPGQSMDEAVVTAERLRTAVAAVRVETPSGPLAVTASFGCATAGDVAGSVDALVRLADERLYEAKHAGRNRVGHGATLADAA